MRRALALTQPKETALAQLSTAPENKKSFNFIDLLPIVQLKRLSEKASTRLHVTMMEALNVHIKTTNSRLLPLMCSLECRSNVINFFLSSFLFFFLNFFFLRTGERIMKESENEKHREGERERESGNKSIHWIKLTIKPHHHRRFLLILHFFSLFSYPLTHSPACLPDSHRPTSNNNEWVERHRNPRTRPKESVYSSIESLVGRTTFIIVPCASVAVWVCSDDSVSHCGHWLILLFALLFIIVVFFFFPSSSSSLYNFICYSRQAILD